MSTPSVLWSSGFMRRATLEIIILGIVSGFVGVHVLLRRLSFFTMAMTHATFPGVVIAYGIGVAPLAGSLGFGWLVVAAVVILGALDRLDGSSGVAVVLAGSFGLGVLLQSSLTHPGKDLSSLLVGQVLGVSRADVALTAIAAVVVLGFLTATHKELVYGSFDRVASEAAGYSRWLEVGLLLAVETTVVTTVPAVGTMLSVALTVVPALIARLWVDHLAATFAVSVAAAVGSGVIGLLIAADHTVAPGSAIALTAGALYVGSWLVGPFGIRRSLVRFTARRCSCLGGRRPRRRERLPHLRPARWRSRSRGARFETCHDVTSSRVRAPGGGVASAMPLRPTPH